MINYPLSLSSWHSEEPRALKKVIESGKYTMGPKVFSYEESFADRFGSKFCVMVNSGSSANLLMIASLFYTQNPRHLIKPGDEVLVPAISWATTFAPLAQYGLKIRFVDVDKKTLNFNMRDLENAINDNTRVIFATNLLGNPNDFRKINEIIGNRDIILLEDNCESMGAKFEAKECGSFGLMGTFSSFFSHHISTMEGGCIVTDDEQIYHILLSLRAHGWVRDLPKESHLRKTTQNDEDPFWDLFNFVLPGYNLRPLEMSGAVGIEQLKKFNGFLKHRRENASHFCGLFEDHPWLSIQTETGKSSWFGFALVLKKESERSRRDVIELLHQNGVEVRPIVTGNFMRQDVINYFDIDETPILPNADYVHQNGFFIGNHHINLKDKISKIRELLT